MPLSRPPGPHANSLVCISAPFGNRYGSTLDPLACRGIATGTRGGAPCQGVGYYHTQLAKVPRSPRSQGLLFRPFADVALQRITAHFVNLGCLRATGSPALIRLRSR